MTVAELIEKLKAMPQDGKIYVAVYFGATICPAGNAIKDSKGNVTIE